MATYKYFTEMEVWQRSRTLSNDVFKYTVRGAFLRDFSLRDQINRACGSIMDNIAEGFERSSKNEFVNALSYSKGSCGEVISQLYRALDREYISIDEFNRLKDEAESIGRMLNGFIAYLNKSNITGFKFKDRR